MRFVPILLAMLMLSSVVLAADQNIGKPGITPDSPFYFLDKMFDVFQSRQSVAFSWS